MRSSAPDLTVRNIEKLKKKKCPQKTLASWFIVVSSLNVILMFISGVKCPDITNQSIFGQVKGAKFFFPNTIEVQCNSGYWRPEKERRLACNASGDWMPTVHPCQKIWCEITLNASNVTIIASEQVHYGEEVQYECPYAHRLNAFDPDEVSTTNNTVVAICVNPPASSSRPLGELVPSPSGFLCELITCQLPSQPPNGTARWNKTMFESEVVYECDGGFSLSGSSTRWCGKDGEWSGEAPSCTGKTAIFDRIDKSECYSWEE